MPDVTWYDETRSVAHAGGAEAIVWGAGDRWRWVVSRNCVRIASGDTATLPEAKRCAEAALGVVGGGHG